MPTDNAASWDQHAQAYLDSARLPTDVATYGPDIPDESELGLIGRVDGKRILELGCGGAQCSIAFAKQGATAIGVDFSVEMLAHARRLADAEGVKIELRHGDLADLVFLSNSSVDAVFSAYAFGFVEDLSRVFRQCHRVLRNGAPLVFSMAHPAYDMIDDEHPTDALRIRRSYFDWAPIEYEWNGIPFTDYRHSIESLVTGLNRSGYRIDAILEPEPLPEGSPRSSMWRETFNYVPRTLIVKARKEGGH